MHLLTGSEKRDVSQCTWYCLYKNFEHYHIFYPELCIEAITIKHCDLKHQLGVDFIWHTLVYQTTDSEHLIAIEFDAECPLSQKELRRVDEHTISAE